MRFPAALARSALAFGAAQPFACAGRGAGTPLVWRRIDGDARAPGIGGSGRTRVRWTHGEPA